MPIEGGETDVIDIAGQWTIGVTQGVIRVFIPVLAFSIGVGLALRISKMGVRMGSGE